MTAPASPFPWRRPLEADWSARQTALLKRLGAEDNDWAATGVEARRLADQRLGPIEQFKTGKLAGRLWPHRDRLPGLRPMRIALLSNAMVEALAADLKAAGLARGLLLDVVVPPFNSVEAIAAGAAGLEGDEPLDAVILLLDAAAFPISGPLLDAGDEARRLAESADRLRTLVGNLRARLLAPVVLATAPSLPDHSLASADAGTAGSAGRFIARLNADIADGAAAGGWLVWDLAALAARIGHDRWSDPAMYHHAKTPFAVENGPVAADNLCALLAAMVGRSGRALVLDLDNTVWGGVIGDDGVEGIVIGQGSARGEAFLAVQRLALDLRARGVVLAVCSKNTEAVALRPFSEHPDMLLRPEHIAVFKASWGDKATALKEIAQALNLGVESLVFLDDNPVERAWVREALPGVTVIEVGEDPSWYPRMVAASGAFEHLPLGADDLGRAETYKQLGERQAARSDPAAYEAYLRSLDMRMTIAPFDAVGRARIAQLINKSNQFNLTTRRYTDAAVEAVESDPDVIGWQIRLVDRFADQGMIAVVIVRKPDPARWTIDSWLMSCRVLERGVEQTIMNQLVARAAAAGVEVLEGEFIRTPKNGMVETFFDRMGFAKLGEEQDGRVAYELKVADYRPLPSTIAVSQA
ncbi:MAG: HAD-IIIC family phosphatase [Caulobacteraceae bacterium]|nr:MAG: HAD-IIIC family phosphatase [Caulobacteraceae bacterium]